MEAVIRNGGERRTTCPTWVIMDRVLLWALLSRPNAASGRFLLFKVRAAGLDGINRDTNNDEIISFCCVRFRKGRQQIGFSKVNPYVFTNSGCFDFICQFLISEGNAVGKCNALAQRRATITFTKSVSYPNVVLKLRNSIIWFILNPNKFWRMPLDSA